MKKFNKILALGLVGASALTGGFMLSGCDATTNNNATQTEQNQDEQKAVSSIGLNADTLPNYIIKGKFARTNITMTVTYEDGSTKVVDVTESMFNETDKEKLNNVGQYDLTVNYGDKTATMYANVVDERYLLKEVVEANFDKDVTITVGDYTSKLDMDNKIIYNYDVSDDYTNWIWLNNNVCYDYEVEDSYDGVNKGLVSDFDDIVNNTYEYLVLDMLNGVDEDGDTWTIDSIEKDGLNYILTAKHVEDDYITTYKYIFNDDFLLKVECEDNDPETWEYNFNYTPITLEVPTEIKALESTATIHLASRIDDLRSVMEDYLESDFETVVTGDMNVTIQYDFDNKIMYANYQDWYQWSWVNGDYKYSYESDDEGLVSKNHSSNWNDRVQDVMFMEDVLYNGNSTITIDISEDGKYYILTAVCNPEIRTGTFIYKFTDNEILSLTIEDEEDSEDIRLECTYTKKSINLEVPAEIKALESSAQ